MNVGGKEKIYKVYCYNTFSGLFFDRKRSIFQFLFNKTGDRKDEINIKSPSKEQSYPTSSTQNISKKPISTDSRNDPLKYVIVMSEQVYNEAERYKMNITECKRKAGWYLENVYKEIPSLKIANTLSFIEMLLRTKKPTIFAESAIQGDLTDWNQTELEILSDIGVAVPVTIYDDGRHGQKSSFETPFSGYLLYISGALLAGKGMIADLPRVTGSDRKTISLTRYEALYQKRLIPMLFFANETAQKDGKQAVITIPGLGCGCFAGSYKGQLDLCVNIYRHRNMEIGSRL